MKKSLKTIMAAAGIIAAAGSAQALDINIYGSSAQFTYLKGISSDLITAAGCANVGRPPLSDSTGSYVMNYGAVADGAATGLCNNSDTGIGGPAPGPNLTGGINIRISNKSSRDGIKAAIGTNSGGGAGSGCSTAGTALFMTYYSTSSPASCQTVSFGASDVNASTFNEANQGCEFGPVYFWDGANFYCASPDPINKICKFNQSGLNHGNASFPGDCWRDVTGSGTGETGTLSTAGAISTANLTVTTPLVLPFAFYVNNTVQVSTCAAGTHAGHICDPTNINSNTGNNANCEDALTYSADGTQVLTSNPESCTAGPMTNITRLQATQIFSNTVNNWTEMGTEFSSSAGPTTEIRLCLRTAGSGTLATLNRQVMFGSTWGKALAQVDASGCYPNSGTFPGCMKNTDNIDNVGSIWFNNSTDDMLHCINSLNNAIGVADADACDSDSPYVTGGNVYQNYYGPVGLTTAPPGTFTYGSNTYPMTNLCSNIHQLTYQGVAPFRENVRNGIYDFWTKEELYMNTSHVAAGDATNTFFSTILNTFQNNPAHINFTKQGLSAQYFTSVNEMRFSKTTDIVYPTHSLSTPNPVKP